jgi:hypothetical protein
MKGLNHKHINHEVPMLYSPGRSMFLLFEENPHWYAIGGEAILQIAEKSELKVCIFGNQNIYPLDRSRGWRRISSRRKNLTNSLRKIRFLVWRYVPYLRPSRKLIHILKKWPQVEIIKVKTKKSKWLTPVQNLQINLLETIVQESLKEDFGTTSLTSKNMIRRKERYLKSAIQASENINELIKLHQCEEIYLINGRTLYERIAYEIALKMNIRVFTFESEISSGKLQRYEGLIFDSDRFMKLVEDFWTRRVARNGLHDCLSKGSKYFLDRRKLHSVNRFLQDFEATGFNKFYSKVTYTYFSSSNDEMDSLYSIYGENPPDQNVIIRDLVGIFERKEMPNAHLIIRMHPNIRTKSDEEKKRSIIINDSDNVTFFNFDSQVNSYELLMNSDVVLSCGSTIGLESAFSGTPNISFGKTFWSGFSVSKYLKDPSEIINYEPSNLEMMKLDATKVGFFFAHFGEDFRYFDLEKKKYLPDNNHLDVFRKFFRKFTK